MSVIVEASILLGYSSVVSEGGGNAYVPKLFLSGGFFNLSVYCIGGGHNEHSEVFSL